MAVISKLNENGKDITKYNNATISNINFNGADYHFAKPIQVENGICDDAVAEPLIDMQISGESIQDGTPTPDAPIEIESVGDKTKNLFNKTDATMMLKVRVEADGIIYDNTIQNYQTAIIKVKPNTKYTVNVNVSGYTGQSPVGRNAFYTTYPTIGVTVGTVNSTIFGSIYPRTVTTPADAQYWAIWVNRSTNINQQVLDSLIIVEGEYTSETMPSYEPYGYKIPLKVNDTITNIYLNKPLRKVGDEADYIDYKNKKVVRKVGVKTTDFKQYSYNSQNKYLYLTNKMTSFSDKIFNSFNCISNKIATFKSFPGSADSNALMVSGNSFYYFVVAEESEIQTYIDLLAETEIHYILKQPDDTETIELSNISTFKGTNIFDIETNVKPSSLQIEYWKQI